MGTARLPRLSLWVAAVAGAQLVALLVTSTRYGYHRDELYFIVAGRHPAFGYPDQPPLVPLLCRAMDALDPGSLFLLRLPSALVAVATTVLAAVVAREVSGGRRAQLIAAACTGCSGFALAVGHFVTTTTFDVLSTTLLGWLLIRGVRLGGGPTLLAAGVVVGVGCEAKPQVAFVAVVLVAVLVIVGPRAPLRSWWTAGGFVAAVVLIAPYAIWQQVHGWPQLTVAQNVAGSAEGGRAGFVPFQLVMVSPVLAPVWIAGLLAPFRRVDWRPLRFLPIGYGLLAILYLVGNGKAYYLASLYPVLLGLGAIPTAAWTLRRRLNLRLLTAGIAVSAVVSAVIALPLLPERSLQGSVVMALNPDQGETVGWPRFLDTVARAWHDVPPAERTRTAIFTANYGEAGAIDVLGGTRGLPHAYSGHNGFSEWARPPDADVHALLIGYHVRYASQSFTGCRQLATIDDGVGLDNDEQGEPVLLCRALAPWSTLWPRLRRYE